MTFKLPENMDTMEGALIEPLAVGLHAANQAGAVIGKSAAILGTGSIGLVTMLALKAMGITDIYMTDKVKKRLDMAQKLGVTAAYNIDDCDIVNEIMNTTAYKGVDMVFETAGNISATQQTVELVKRGGSIVLIGMSPDTLISYNIGKLISKEASINTVFRYRNIYPSAIKAVSAGLIPIKQIITHTFKFDDLDNAMKYSIKNKSDMVKGIVEF